MIDKHPADGKRAFKGAAPTRNIAHFTKSLAGRTSALAVANSNWEAALSGKEWRDGPAIQQLALPTVRPTEPCRLIGHTGIEEVFDVKHLWPIAGSRIPNVQPLVRAIVLGNFGRAQRLAPGEVRDGVNAMPVVYLQGYKHRVVVRVAQAGRRVDGGRLVAKHGLAEDPGAQGTVGPRTARWVRVE